MDTAKLFWSGRSQAVRLPRAYRIDGGEVRIRRAGAAIVLEPLADSWDWLDSLEAVDADMAAAALEHAPEQERPALDAVFAR